MIFLFFNNRLQNYRNTNLKLISKQINNATHIVITLGTAWVYNVISTNSTVANCHKLPQNEFNKVLLSIEEIKQENVAIFESKKKSLAK